MIQPSLHINTGLSNRETFEATLITVEKANTSGFESSCLLTLNGTEFEIPLITTTASLNALEISNFVNALLAYTSQVNGTVGLSNQLVITPIESGTQLTTTYDANGSGMTVDIEMSDILAVTNVDNWLRCDLDEGVTISIKDAIKKAKDVGKVFTAYTNPFNLPASKINNRIFKRFSDPNVSEGFDPRRKYPAMIKLNGVDFKKGYVKLNKVDMKNNLPLKYSIQFFGELTSLKDILSTSKLKDLSALSRLSHEYSDENVMLGFEKGFNVTLTAFGERQTTAIPILTPPTSSGTAVITLDGSDYDLILSNGLTADQSAEQIASAVNNIDGYATGVSGGNIVLIVADEIGPQVDTVFDAGTATGLTFNVVTVTEGTIDPNEEGSVQIIPSSSGDIKYSLLSHTRGFEHTDEYGFHRMLTTEEKNDDYVVVDTDRLNRFDLKPSLKISKILEAIEIEFPALRFNKDWLFGTAETQASTLNEIYLWLHNKKGYIGYTNSTGESTKTAWQRTLKNDGAGYEENEWVHRTTLGSVDIRPFENTTGVPQYYTGEFKVANMVGDGDINLYAKVYKDDVLWETFVESGSADADVTCFFHFPETEYSSETGRWHVITGFDADTSIQQVTPSVVMTWHYFASNQGNFTKVGHYQIGCAECSQPQPIDLIDTIIPNLLMPDQKIIDFLSNLFKTWNLVAFEERLDDGSYLINIQSLDHYLSTGNQHDITQYIDISKANVERISPYSVVEYKFKEPKTFLAINQKEITGDDFGNVTFNVNNFNEGDNSSNSLLFDGGTYEVEPSLEKLMYERLSSYPSKDETDIQWGWFVNDNKQNTPEPTIGSPLLMYTDKKGINTGPIEWNNGELSSFYNAPSNVSSDGSNTLHFNNEFDEWTKNLNPNSLFANFHNEYISGIYSPYARRYNVKAHLPPLIFSVLKLNDVIIIDRVSYFIDTMDVNITTSMVKFSLLRVTDLEKTYEGRRVGSDTWDTTTENWESKTNNWND